MSDAERIVVVGLGDSITAGNPGWDPDPARRALEDPGDDPRSQYLYWAAQADPRIEFRNCGVGGERTDEIRARFDASVEGADVLVVQGGINDVVRGRDVELRRPTSAGWCAPASSAGRRRGRERPSLEPRLAGRRAGIRRLNGLIGEIGRDEGVAVLRFHETLEDPERPGRMAEPWTADGNHPSVEGHRRLGESRLRSAVATG